MTYKPKKESLVLKFANTAWVIPHPGGAPQHWVDYGPPTNQTRFIYSLSRSTERHLIHYYVVHPIQPDRTRFGIFRR